MGPSFFSFFLVVGLRCFMEAEYDDMAIKAYESVRSGYDRSKLRAIYSRSPRLETLRWGDMSEQNMHGSGQISAVSASPVHQRYGSRVPSLICLILA